LYSHLYLVLADPRMKKASITMNHLISAKTMRTMPISAPEKSPLTSAVPVRKEKYPKLNATMTANAMRARSTL